MSKASKRPPTEPISESFPYALDLQTWNNLIANSGTDNYRWNPTTHTIEAGSDGLVEVNLFPQGTGSPGNRGTVDIGSSNNSTADIARQIVYGISPSDLAALGGRSSSIRRGKLSLNGDTGISAGVKDELASIMGQPRVHPDLFERQRQRQQRQLHHRQMAGHSHHERQAHRLDVAEERDDPNRPCRGEGRHPVDDHRRPAATCIPRSCWFGSLRTDPQRYDRQAPCLASNPIRNDSSAPPSSRKPRHQFRTRDCLAGRLRSRRRGAAATEFAIVAPVFFLMVIGFIEFGRALMVQQVLVNASRVGAGWPARRAQPARRCKPRSPITLRALPFPESPSRFRPIRRPPPPAR